MENKRRYRLSIIPLLVLLNLSTIAQDWSYETLHVGFNKFDSKLYKDSNFHTSVKPFLLPQVAAVVSIDSINRKKVQSKWADIVFNRSLIEFKKEDFAFTIDPLMNFEFGKAKDSANFSYINTRGILVNAQLGKSVFVSTSFYENQARFNDYRYGSIEKNKQRIIPGQGIGKAFNDSVPQSFDYGFAEGYVSFSPNPHFNFTFGHGKNFIGDGYRSLLLSDNSFNYPFFKISTDFWKIKYINLWSQYQDLRQSRIFESAYAKKWSSIHYLDWNVTNWLSIGFFEAIVWQNADSTGVRGFDINYANPVIFLRPVEFSVGSPDNALMGINGKIVLFKNQILYGQAIIDEFKLSELKARNGWWANKWGIQAGYKTYNLFNVEKLYIQTEFNYVRPFMYSHNSSIQNYAHYNQALAHPLGANFWEWVNFIRYNKSRIYFEGRFSYALHGRDTANLNFGNDLYASYSTRAKEYDNYVGQAETVKLLYATAQISYLINKRSNLNFYLKYTYRKESSNSISTNQGLFTLGLRTSLQNFYYDY